MQLLDLSSGMDETAFGDFLEFDDGTSLQCLMIVDCHSSKEIDDKLNRLVKRCTALSNLICRGLKVPGAFMQTAV